MSRVINVPGEFLHETQLIPEPCDMPSVNISSVADKLSQY